MMENNVIRLIDLFVDGSDRSISIAQEIEVFLSDAYAEDEFLQDVALTLASYSPGGGEYLYDADYVLSLLVKAKEHILRNQG